MRKACGVCLVALAVVLAACSGSAKRATRIKPISATSTTAPKPVAVAPLTGLPDPTGVAKTHPALTVKIDNTAKGQPKYGVEQADVVYEEVVEGGITRLAAIFNSHAPDRIGPVRSVRRTDQSLVWPIGGLFAYSGGAQYAIDSINTAPVKQLDETRSHDGMFRDHSRRAPWNLYAVAPKLFADGGTPVPPPPLFAYRPVKVAAAGTPTSSFTVGFQAGYATTWNWDATSGTWKRSIFGRPEIAASGVQLAPQNVVVMSVNYAGGAGVEGAEAELTGSGPAWVFTAGNVVQGTWSRPDKSKPATLLDASGRVVALTPGQTWVELPQSGYPVTVTPAP
jgi:DUF3048 family protein